MDNGEAPIPPEDEPNSTTQEVPSEPGAEMPPSGSAAEEPAPEPEPQPEPEPEPDRPRRRVVVMIADSGKRPLDAISDDEATAVWAAISAPWHPAILSKLDALPEVEDVDMPTGPEAGEVRVVAGRAVDYLSGGYRLDAEPIGVPIVEMPADGVERPGLVRRILEALEPEIDSEPVSADDPVVRDYLALGSARWWLRDLTIGMEHVDCLDVDSLARETLAGARSWASGDSAGAVNRLRAAFELLTEARERYYPVDAFIVDLQLLEPTAPADALSDSLAARAPFSLLASARAIEALAGKNPDDIARLGEAINEGWADVIGGPYAETAESLRPLESIRWQFREGATVYRRHLDDRTVETLAGRRFALYPMRPQIARRFGFRFGVHLGFDAGTFPLVRESKRLWESPDGASLESLTRTPISADRPADGLRLAWEMASTMRDDHVATLALVHWPERVAPWFVDFRRVAAYSPVLARWATMGDYFHLTDRPYEVLRPKLDEYVTPYLAQAVARDDPAPISRRARHARLRARLDAADGLRALAMSLDFVAEVLGEPEPDPSDMPDALAFEEAERALETGRLDEAEEQIQALEARWSDEAARRVIGPSESDDEGPKGDLVLNPLSIPRRVAITLPDAPAPLLAEGAVRVSQWTEHGLQAVVDVPAFGYTWIPRSTTDAAIVPPAGPSETVKARGRVLRNEMVRIEFDEGTGGLRSIMAPGDPSPRLGQQLVIAGLEIKDGEGHTRGTRMRGSSFEIEYGGPALVQGISTGSILHPTEDRPLASFRQRVRLWSGRPVAELDIELTDLDPDWLASIAQKPPWQHYFACRWAWPDPNAGLRRSSLLALEATAAARPETAEIFDITARRQRTALLFGGLAHHQRHGPRMLDTLLIAGRESARSFSIGLAIDLEYPFQAAMDLFGPTTVAPTTGGPPRSGSTGWFYRLDARSVAVTRIEPVLIEGEGRGLAFHLLETAGRPARCRLRLFREPVAARQTDFNDERIVELSLDDDAVLLDLTPHELARVVVSLG